MNSKTKINTSFCYNGFHYCPYAHIKVHPGKLSRNFKYIYLGAQHCPASLPVFKSPGPIINPEGGTQEGQGRGDSGQEVRPLTRTPRGRCDRQTRPAALDTGGM